MAIFVHSHPAAVLACVNGVHNGGRVQNRSTIKRVFAFLLLALLSMLVYRYVVVIADPTQAVLKGDSTGIKITEGYLVDPGHSLTLPEVMRDPAFATDRNLEQVPWGFGQQAYWLRLNLHNSTTHAQTLVAHFSNPMLEQLTVYHRQINEPQWQTAKLGWQATELTVKQRAIPAYEMTLPAGASMQLVVRIATAGIAKTPVDIYYKDDFTSLTQMTFLLWGSFVGVLVVMSLFNLVLYAGLKDGVYLVYIGYIVSVLMMLGVVMGFGHYIFPETAMRWLRLHIVSVNLSVVICTLSFALLFFDATDKQSRIVRWCVRYIQLLIALAVIFLVVPEYLAAPVFFVALAFLYPLIGLFLFRQFKRKQRWARYYLLSWIPLVVGGAIQPMSLTGVIEGTFLTLHSMMIGVSIEVVLMAMGLANRMQYKKEQALFNAIHDPGTRLPNATLLEHRIKALVHNRQPFAVCLIEVADFSALQPYISTTDTNDLMVMIARVVNRELLFQPQFQVLEDEPPQVHKLARLKDGLLALLITDDANGNSEALQSIQQQLSSGAQIGELYIALALRFGLSDFGYHNDEQALDVLKQAQQALEQAKYLPAGIAFYHADQAYSFAQRLSLAASLQAALRRNELSLYHQPQVDLNSGQVDGSEALLRWRHPELGYIPPVEFIPLAEDTGIINEITLWVIDRACQDLEVFSALGHEQHNVSVNISGKDIAEPGFLDNVQTILQRHRFPLSNLTFELTESATVNDFHLLTESLHALAAMGVQIAIDDYGTGYSSLFYISELPFTELKIDKSFVSDMDVSPRHHTIVKTTIEMAKSMGLKVVAEGVESAAVETLLHEQGCHIVQGFYYQKPIPLDRYLAWLANRQ